MKRIGLAFVSCFFISINIAAQKPSQKIETDRPDQTESPTIVPKRWLQFEMGLQRLQDAGGPTYTLPTVLSKYGVSKKFELRLITEYTSLYRHHFTDTLGLVPVRIGFKQNLLQESGLLPQISLIAHAGFNRLASRHFKDYTFLAPEFRFTMQHTLSDRWGLGYNLGAEWEQTGAQPEWIYTLAPGVGLGRRWYAYIELFGSIIKNEKPSHNVDGGVAYYLSDNMRADISSGIGLSKNSFDNYVAIGFSFRTPVSKKAVR